MEIFKWAGELLPTKWSGRVVIATGTLALAAFGLPVPDAALSVPMQGALLHVALALLVSTIGLVATVCLVVSAYRKQSAELEKCEKQRDAPPPPPKDPPNYRPIHYSNKGIV